MNSPENDKELSVYCIILNYNGLADTIACLKSLRRSTYRCNIIVIDNASPKGDGQELRKHVHPSEDLIESKVNRGYAAGNNLGLKIAFNSGADVALVVNNDTLVDEGCIDILIRSILKNPDIGIIGPKVLVYDKPEMIDFAGFEGDMSRAKFRRVGYRALDSDKFQAMIPTLYQDGCALAITNTCYSQIGGYDETFWSYWEDFDICVRARDAGFRVVCNQAAKSWHKISASFGSAYEKKPIAVYYRTRNRYVFHKKHAKDRRSKFLLVMILLSKIPRQISSILFKSKRNRWANALVYCQATLVGVFSPVGNPSDLFSPLKGPSGYGKLRKIVDRR